MICEMIIKHAKLSFSLIESQLLPCAPACDNKFHSPAVYLHPTFTAPFQMETIWNPVEHQWWFFCVEIADVFRLLAISAEELHCGCLTGFQMRLCPITYYSSQSSEEKLPSLGLHKAILDSSCLLILWLYSKHKIKR